MAIKAQYNDIITDVWMFKEEKARSLLDCASQCLQHPPCMSFMVNLDTERCRLHASSMTSDDLVSHSPGFKYYESCRAAGSMGSQCSYTSDCRIADMFCISFRCQCLASYHYDPNSQTCVSQCQVWGSDFAAFPDYQQIGHNTHQTEHRT